MMQLKYLIPTLILLSIISLFVGVQDLSIWNIHRFTEEQWETLFISRFPRLLAIIVVGVSLSVCGLIMQQLTQNKFVSPTTAGTLDWARLGILVAIIMFAGASTMESFSSPFCLR